MVVTYDGKPQAGFAITVFGSAMTAVTDDKGRFTLPSLPAGWQTVYARKEGLMLAGQSVYLEQGATEDLILHAQTGGDHLHGMSARVPNLCGSCHVLHQEPLMLGGSANAACFNCHIYRSTTGGFPSPGFSSQAIYEKTPHKTAALLPGNPAGDKGKCENCHEPHGINNDHPGLLLFANAATSNPLCYLCHAVAHGDYAGSGPSMDTTNLHMSPPAASSTPKTYPVTALGDVHPHNGECYNCHDPHGATTDGSAGGQITTYLTRDQADALCVRCHVTSAVAPFQNFRTGTKHTCTLCHNPHLVQRDTVASPSYTPNWKILMAPGDAVRRTPHAVSEYVVTHRGESKLRNEYCLGCHDNTIAPNPLYSSGTTIRPWTDAGSGFRDVRASLTPYGVADTNDAKYRNLHAVHVLGPIGLGAGLGPTTVPGYAGGQGYCFAPGYHGIQANGGGNNLVFCVDCHTVHGSATRPHLLRTDVFLRAPVTAAGSGGYVGYAGKPGCGYGPADLRGTCHAGSATYGGVTNTGCNWCHTGVGSPGISCVCDTSCYSYWTAHGASHAQPYGARGPNGPKRMYVVYF